MNLIGVAPLTVIRLGSGGRANVPAGALVPATIDAEDAARLLEEGFIAEIEIVDETPEPEVAVMPTTIEDILTEVGDDAELAQGFLDVELEKGDKARRTLVEKLEAITEAASS